MTKVPSAGYRAVIAALQRDGWIVARQRGSHIRLQKYVDGEMSNLTVPTHRTIKRSTLAHILKEARMDPEHFKGLL
uniref:Predicted RNA binding protein YcfA, dsRBD-like fold, HicA-like mRNA interferase family n=1 Tax=Candidatus Kentrum sp. LPFa TaxID=2126335 RepID=A0A450VYS9_9GAMM|nr:MAG: Predicted RNA binding protein YcfA, dsRBD-like fold, HicA-like mRNA interferase family [Candidatus Kentron sp. LPFa]VFK25675.1 MAG: Predicted RNA binding protein YcfA, dsRBD-like fold, HicA-like mRNA interferase family [Candidatus Kentron sp. LPFa]